MTSFIDISVPRLSQDPRTRLWRLEAEVDGVPVYFQSAHALSETSEAFVCAFFLIALQQGRALRPAGAVDAGLAENLPSAAAVARRFWGFDGPLPQMQTAHADAAHHDTGMFFTCGVDSFYTLKRNVADVRHLINVHGFDIALEDTDRYQKSLVGLRHTSEALDLNLICVETNLRQHPLYRMANWEVTHGTALAAIGHVLTKHLGIIRIPGSNATPWGSHPDLDGLWSSSQLTLINNELGIRRADKVQDIAHWPPAQAHLKVCWRNLADTLNCGYCEKCLRTQVAFFAAGALEEFTSFPEGDLAERINRLLYVNPVLIPHWVDALNRIDVSSAPGRAIRRLLWRSRILNPMRALAIRLRLGRVKRAILRH